MTEKIADVKVGTFSLSPHLKDPIFVVSNCTEQC